MRSSPEIADATREAQSKWGQYEKRNSIGPEHAALVYCRRMRTIAEKVCLGLN
jgi:hypothetical protein